MEQQQVCRSQNEMIKSYNVQKNIYVYGICQKTSPDIRQTRKAGWVICTPVYCFFHLNWLQLRLKTMNRGRSPASPEAGWRCESEVSQFMQPMLMERVGGCSQIFTFSGSRPSFTHMVTNWSPSRHFPNPAIILTNARRLENGHPAAPEPALRLCFVFQQLSFGISCVFISLFCRQETTRQPKQVSEDGGFRLVSVCRAHVYQRGSRVVLVIFWSPLGPAESVTVRLRLFYGSRRRLWCGFIRTRAQNDVLAMKTV